MVVVVLFQLKIYFAWKYTSELSKNIVSLIVIENQKKEKVMELGSYWLWLVVLVLVHFGMNGSFGCWEQERIALLQYKASTINYIDEYHFTPWDSANKESDCCEWKGVKCNLITGRVIELSLNSTIYWSGESGGGWYFNASLFLPFEDLQYLDLSWNYIPGWVSNEGTKFIS